MTNKLDRRLRKLDGVPAPDLWSRVGSQSHHLQPVEASPARRVAVAVSALALAGATVFYLVAVFPDEPDRVPAVGASTSEPTPTTPPASERLAIYVPLIRELVGTAEHLNLNAPIFVRHLICEGSERPFNPNDECHDAFTDAEQASIVERFPRRDVRFYDEFTPSIDGVRVWVGPLEPRGDDYVVGGGMLCGGLCGSGGTFRLTQKVDGWTATLVADMWIS
jgi:hypothetical protein